MNVSLYENVIKDIDSYVCDVINKGFEDIQIGEDLFKNVRQRGEDELVRFLLEKYPNFIFKFCKKISRTSNRT